MKHPWAPHKAWYALRVCRSKQITSGIRSGILTKKADSTYSKTVLALLFHGFDCRFRVYHSTDNRSNLCWLVEVIVGYPLCVTPFCIGLPMTNSYLTLFTSKEGTTLLVVPPSNTKKSCDQYLSLLTMYHLVSFQPIKHLSTPTVPGWTCTDQASQFSNYGQRHFLQRWNFRRPCALGVVGFDEAISCSSTIHVWYWWVSGFNHEE